MKELGDLLGLEPSEVETAGVMSRNQPALPGDVENFDAEGTALWPWFSFRSCVLCSFVMCFGVCRFYEEFGSLRDRKSWPNHGVIMREGLCCVLLSFL